MKSDMNYIEFVENFKRTLDTIGIKHEVAAAWLKKKNRSTFTKKLITKKKDGTPVKPPPITVEELFTIADKMGVHPSFFFGLHQTVVISNDDYKALLDRLERLEKQPGSPADPSDVSVGSPNAGRKGSSR